MNRISSLPEFQNSCLAKEFRNLPFGFVDVGALGGIHPVVEPVASHTHAICFEPDPAGAAALRQKYGGKSSYAGVTILETALGGPGSGREQLYISKVPTNTSLLKPSEHFIRRYNARKFEVDRVVDIKTRTLDDVLAENPGIGPRPGELMKLDTQGSEFRILKGAHNLLSEGCLGIWCEVEFFQVYENQETFTDLDGLLRDYGFSIYGLYPHYRSIKALDRRHFNTEERLMWADAVFIKDPLDSRNANRSFSTRDLNALILIALLTRFYDLGIEIIRHVYSEGPERTALESMVRGLAAVNGAMIQGEIEALYKACSQDWGEASILAAEFISRHRSNNTIDHLLDRSR